jgi:hypothetical protein
MTLNAERLFEEQPPRCRVILAPSALWPAEPGPDAYHGLPGEIVAQLAPHTEADPVAILTQLLVAFGAAVGRGAYFTVEATRHHPNEFLLLVGESAKARKGSSWDHVARLLARADPTIVARILSGLSSGEGLIWAVRDPISSDPGPSDHRLLVVESEFASVLKQTAREINTLSPALRSAWDGRPLQLLTRTAPARAAAAHISVIGHITAAELRHHTSTVELANGFINRFMLIAARRVQLLPDGGDPDPLARSPLQQHLAQNLTNARHAGQLRLDKSARDLWREGYADLSQPSPGITAAVSARAEAHTIRLALIYALINAAKKITTDHLHAALALWAYAARSAAWALDPTTSDPLAREIHAALTHTPTGLTRTQLRDLYHRNQPAQRIDQALATLEHAGKATPHRILTAGRPAQLWTATPAETPAARAARAAQP